MLAAGLAGPNSLKASRKGANRITFDDGTYIEWDNPGVIISGLLYGERIVSFTGSWTIEYPAFRIVCDVVFNPNPTKKSWGSMFRRSNKKEVTPSDHLTATISLLDPEGNKSEVKVGYGSWLEHVTFDD